MQCIVAVHVDDLIITSESEEMISDLVVAAGFEYEESG